jgi:two-component system, LytTR family, response regulator LytT
MNVLIIEDELLGAEALKSLLAEQYPAINVLAIKDSIKSAAAWLLSHEAPDLIFMDIELADGPSFELFNEVDIKSPVIFTTSYDEYALKAFRYNSIDYLLKPIGPEDLARSLAKVQNLKEQLNSRATTQPDWQSIIRQIQSPAAAFEYRERFLVKQGQRLFSVEIGEIAYFFSRGKLSFIKCRDGRDFCIDYTLDQLEPMLAPKTFYRVNRQVIAAHSAVVQVHTWFNGKLKVTLSPPTEEETIVSREKAKEFRQWMGE